MKFERIEITPGMRLWAEGQESKHVKGPRYDPGIDRGDSVFVGYLGDSLFQAKFPAAEHVDLPEYDFIYKGHKIEIKTYKTNHAPKLEYYVQVPEADIERSQGFYAFIAIHSSFSHGWLVGWMKVDRFKDVARFRTKGEIREHPAKIKYTADCGEVMVAALVMF